MTATVVDAEPWWTRAACHNLTVAQTDATFFPPRRTYNGTDVYARARPYCDRCPVTTECLADALKRETGAGYPYGFRGGCTPRQRADLRKVRVTG